LYHENSRKSEYKHERSLLQVTVHCHDNCYGRVHCSHILHTRGRPGEGLHERYHTRSIPKLNSQCIQVTGPCTSPVASSVHLCTVGSRPPCLCASFLYWLSQSLCPSSPRPFLSFSSPRTMGIAPTFCTRTRGSCLPSSRPSSVRRKWRRHCILFAQVPVSRRTGALLLRE